MWIIILYIPITYIVHQLYVKKKKRRKKKTIDSNSLRLLSMVTFKSLNLLIWPAIESFSVAGERVESWVWLWWEGAGPPPRVSASKALDSKEGEEPDCPQRLLHHSVIIIWCEMKRRWNYSQKHKQTEKKWLGYTASCKGQKRRN